MMMHTRAVESAGIVGARDPEDDAFLCDIEIPGERYVFVAATAADGAVTFSSQAPSWLTGELTDRLAARVRAAAVRQADSPREHWAASARRRLVLDGEIVDSGRRRDGQVCWVHHEFLPSC